MRNRNRIVSAFLVGAVLLGALVTSVPGTMAATDPTNAAVIQKAETTKAVREQTDRASLTTLRDAKRDRSLLHMTGEVTSMTANSITVEGRAKLENENSGGNETLTFSVDDQTIILRRGLGIGAYDEVSVGDEVEIWADVGGDNNAAAPANSNAAAEVSTRAKALVNGDVSGTVGRAVIIWDKSIWMTEIKGFITDINEADRSFTIMVKIRGVGYTTNVRTDNNTVFVFGRSRTGNDTVRPDNRNGNQNGNRNRNQNTNTGGGNASFDDLEVGQSVKVRGSWSQRDMVVVAKRVEIGSAADMGLKATITKPDATTKYTFGQPVELDGTCTSKSNMPLPNCTYSWEVKKLNKGGAPETVFGPTAASTTSTSSFTPVLTDSDSSRTTFEVVLTVKNGSAEKTATKTIKPMLVGLKANITKPDGKTKFSINQPVELDGTCTSRAKVAIPGCTYSWEVKKLNSRATPETVFGPTEASTTSTSSFTPVFTATDNSRTSYQVILTVKNGNEVKTATRTIKPMKVRVKLSTSPKGLQLSINGLELRSNVNLTMVAGAEQTIEAVSPQTRRGVEYTFESWSDGGAQSHTIVAPSEKKVTYTATYRATGGDTNGNQNGNRNSNRNTNRNSNSNANSNVNR